VNSVALHETREVVEAVAFEHDKLGGATSAARFREEASKAGAKWRS